MTVRWGGDGDGAAFTLRLFEEPRALAEVVGPLGAAAITPDDYEVVGDIDYFAGGGAEPFLCRRPGDARVWVVDAVAGTSEVLVTDAELLPRVVRVYDEAAGRVAAGAPLRETAHAAHAEARRIDPGVGEELLQAMLHVVA